MASNDARLVHIHIVFAYFGHMRRASTEVGSDRAGRSKSDRVHLVVVFFVSLHLE